MAYHDDLLDHAMRMAHTAPPTQAALRRAVSTAYYAVFHLLIAGATANWSNSALRTALGRAFEHGQMRSASNRILNPREFPFADEEPRLVESRRFVARKFTELREYRHFADYNLTEGLEPTGAIDQVRSAEAIFQTWDSIRDSQIAQEYLVSLLVKHR